MKKVLSSKLEIVDKLEAAQSSTREMKLRAERLLEATFSKQEATILEAISVFQEVSGEIYKNPSGFDIEKTSENFDGDIVLALDDTERGGLFGFRFERDTELSDPDTLQPV